MSASFGGDSSGNVSIFDTEQRLGVFDADVEASMTAGYCPEIVGRATLSAIRIAADFRGLDFRFSLERGVPWVPQQQPQQQ
ncbi:hypothetical protein E3N88_15914 [Mikania micrantha]|uniref:Uncharacterized protein n=1 Tax=Mikania micrantha TaxID=192012 RepID=A0A5N6NWY8_9ASTR|nr:hypothetical protein E3N88_15914 [Mikania micrantha]